MQKRWHLHSLHSRTCAAEYTVRARQTSTNVRPTHAKTVALARTESTRSHVRRRPSEYVRDKHRRMRINPCKSGTARMESNSFTCSGRRNHSGSTCETNIDECASNPCKNGGTCKDGINSFTSVRRKLEVRADKHRRMCVQSMQKRWHFQGGINRSAAPQSTLEVRARQTSTNVRPTHAKTVALARTESTRSLARAPQGTLEVRARQTSTTAHPTHAKTVALARTESTRSLARAPQGTLEVRAKPLQRSRTVRSLASTTVSISTVATRTRNSTRAKSGKVTTTRTCARKAVLP